jgi:hypothetical protein
LPIRVVFKTKLRSDGKVDKLKIRIAIRGDMDQGVLEEDNSAPASFRLLKVFLADAARLRKRIYQSDFIAAYLQSRMDRIVYVRLPIEFIEFFPDLAEWLVYLYFLRNRHTASTPPVDYGLKNYSDGILNTVSFNRKLTHLYLGIKKLMSG